MRQYVIPGSPPSVAVRKNEIPPHHKSWFLFLYVLTEWNEHDVCFWGRGVQDKVNITTNTTD